MMTSNDTKGTEELIEPVVAQEFSDEEAYEAIEELQHAAALASSEPMGDLFNDTAALVAFLMNERDDYRQRAAALSQEVETLKRALQPFADAAGLVPADAGDSRAFGISARSLRRARSALSNGSTE